MSSVTSSFAQKSGRTKFLLGVTSDVTQGNNDLLSALTFDAPLPTIPQTVITLTAFNALAATSYGFSVGTLFKDLGREIVVYDDAVAGSPHREVFRECMLVSGASTEGISGVEADVRVFVKVFSASGSGVAVARTG